MLGWLHRAQFFFEICLLTFQKYGWVVQRGNAIGRLLHYTKNSLSSTCTSQHKHEQKDRTKTLAEFLDHIHIDFAFLYHRKHMSRCVDVTIDDVKTCESLCDPRWFMRKNINNDKKTCYPIYINKL